MKPKRPPQPRHRGFTNGQLVIVPDGRQGVVIDVSLKNEVCVGFWNGELHEGLETQDAVKEWYPMADVEILKEHWWDK